MATTGSGSRSKCEPPPERAGAEQGSGEIADRRARASATGGSLAGGGPALTLPLHAGGQIETLIRDELALARAEIDARLSRVARHAGILALGAVVALTGLFTLVASLVLLLVAAGMPAWGSALLIGLGLAAVGALVATGGLAALRGEAPTPSEATPMSTKTTAWKGQAN